MSWEHRHIAAAALERRFAPERVTLRQLLGLDRLADVPASWPGSTYDYLWIVDHASGSATPTGFHMQKQAFPDDPDVPRDAWGVDQRLPPDCEG
jgi:hypothetical protein